MTEVEPKKAVFHNKIPKPVGFGDHYFKSKVECTTEGKRRISKYKVGQTLSIKDTKFFKEMFKLHPDYKISLGVVLPQYATTLIKSMVQTVCLSCGMMAAR